MNILVWLILGAIAVATFLAVGQHRRRAFVRDYAFPPGLRQRLRRQHPQVSSADIEQVLAGLRDWFEIAQRAGGQRIGMPSRIVDDAWHEFIVDTRAYREFCRGAFGKPFDHIPAEALGTGNGAREGLRRTWRLACARESIDPRKPWKLPRLFALDAQLAVPGGFVYSLDEQGREDAKNPSTSFGCGGGCAGSASSCDPGSDGCADGGGGDGGGGCGGGCGGD